MGNESVAKKERIPMENNTRHSSGSLYWTMRRNRYSRAYGQNPFIIVLSLI